jgi:prevent-host-death family protein
MSRISVSEAREELSETLNRVAYGHERVVLHRHGKDVAAVVSMKDLVLFERLLEEYETRLDVKEADKALAESGERVRYELIRRELGLTE